VEKAAGEEWQRRLETATREGSLRAPTVDLEVAVLTILHHPDSSRVGERLTLPELAPGEVVALSRVEPGFAAPGESRKRPLAEPHLSRRPLHLIASGKRVGLRYHQTSTSVLANGEAVDGGRGKHGEILIDSRVEGLLESCGEETRSRRLEPSERPARSPREIGDEELVAALATNRWHPGSTARQLGISRASLYVLIDHCPRTRKAGDLSRQEVEQAQIDCGGRIEEMVERLQVSTGGIKRRMRLLGIRGAVPAVER